MTFVQDSVRVGTEAPYGHLGTQSERRRDLPNRTHAHSIDATGLDVDDDGTTHPGASRQVGLSPTPALPKCTNQSSKPRVIHSK